MAGQNIKDGKGSIDNEPGVRRLPYGFSSRVAGKPGSNPKELIGAVDAARFTTALSLILGEAEPKAELMDTNAEVSLDKGCEGCAITAVHLTLGGRIPPTSDAVFKDCTQRPRRAARSPSPSSVHHR